MANILKIEYDMQELRDGIKAAVMEALSGETLDDIRAEIKRDFIEQLKPEVEAISREKAIDFVEELLCDIAENSTVSVGGGWKEEAKIYTYREFVKEEIRKIVEKEEIKVRTPNGRNDYSSVKFSDYVINHCVDGEIEKHIKTNIDALRKDVNSKVKEIFDTQTRNMLSETVMGVIMQSDIYRRIDGNIKCIADKSSSQ